MVGGTSIFVSHDVAGEEHQLGGTHWGDILFIINLACWDSLLLQTKLLTADVSIVDSHLGVWGLG